MGMCPSKRLFHVTICTGRRGSKIFTSPNAPSAPCSMHVARARSATLFPRPRQCHHIVDRFFPQALVQIQATTAIARRRRRRRQPHTVRARVKDACPQHQAGDVFRPQIRVYTPSLSLTNRNSILLAAARQRCCPCRKVHWTGEKLVWKHNESRSLGAKSPSLGAKPS